MSRVAQIQKAVDKAFLAAGDLVGTFTLKRESNVFNPATSEYVSTSSTFTCQGVFDNDKSKYAPLTELQKGMTRVWLKSTEPPRLTDVLVLPSSAERAIVEIKPVQANTTVFIYEVILGS
jgi:hypothetical protein